VVSSRTSVQPVNQECVETGLAGPLSVVSILLVTVSLPLMTQIDVTDTSSSLSSQGALGVAQTRPCLRR